MTTSERLKEKARNIEVLVEIIERIERMREDVCQKYEIVGKTDEQATYWSTGELMWEDEEKTIPKMKDRYDYVTYDVEDLGEEDRYRYDVYTKILTFLEKMA